MAFPIPKQGSFDKTEQTEQRRKWIGELFNSDLYSDLQLISGEKSYAAHRIVVCFHSSVIRDKIITTLVESKPGVTGGFTFANKYRFEDDDPQCVDCVIQYFYRWNYEIPDQLQDVKMNHEPEDIKDADSSLRNGSTVAGSELVAHVKVFALAEKYAIGPLKALSVSKFEATAQQHWGSHYLAEAAREAYKPNVPDNIREMRDSIVEFLHTRLHILREGPMKQLLLALPQLSLDLHMRRLTNTAPASALSIFGRK
ncbi:unnamed protein product [Fusarium langsethiae]|nr:unnamed protein product [Fusarium langsethiae]